jgi:hypothetical protein
MRLANAAHDGPWPIREIASDFEIVDVWALPAHGGAADFRTLVEIVASLDPADTGSAPARVVWRFRERLGEWLHLDGGPEPIPGTNENTLASRLPEGLRGTAAAAKFEVLPFSSLYLTDVDFAAEFSNQTMHGVLHVAWVPQSEGHYRGQMAIYVKLRGLLGKTYKALVMPARHWILYPAILRKIDREWNRRAAHGRS